MTRKTGARHSFFAGDLRREPGARSQNDFNASDICAECQCNHQNRWNQFTRILICQRTASSDHIQVQVVRRIEQEPRKRRDTNDENITGIRVVTRKSPRVNRSRIVHAMHTPPTRGCASIFLLFSKIHTTRSLVVYWCVFGNVRT